MFSARQSGRFGFAVWFLAAVLAFGQLPSEKSCFGQDPLANVPAKLAKALDVLPKVIAKEMEEQNVPGAALAIVHDGQIDLLKGFGVSNVKSEAEVDPRQTIFRLGSISKAITFLGLAKLCEQNGISFDEDVFKYVVDLPEKSHRHGPVSFTNLMQHSGGFDQIGTNRVFFEPEKRPAFHKFLSRDLKSIRPAGQLPCYDTYGPTLAGYAIEKITGEDFKAWLTREIFNPAGMTNSFVETPAEKRTQLATGYGVQAGELVPMDYEYYASTPASSIDSTAADMANLMIAILGDGSNQHGRIFSAASTGKIVSRPDRTNNAMPQFSSGFWEMFRKGNLDRRILHHGGMVDGYAASLCLLPDERFGVFIAANRNSETGPLVGLVDEIPFGVIDRVFSIKPANLFDDFDPAKVSTDELAGTYISNLYCHTMFEGDGWPSRGRTILVEAMGPGEISIMGDPFLAVDRLNFTSPGSQQTVQFHERTDGTICGLSYNFRAPGTTYEKLDSALVKEVFATEKMEKPNPISALVFRSTGRWEEAADIYVQHAASIDDKQFSKPWANFRAGSCLLEAGLFSDAEQRLDAAIEQFRSFENEGENYINRTCGLVAKRTRNESMKILVKAFVAQHKTDEAATLLRAMAEEFGDSAISWMKTLSNDHRMKELFANPAIKRLLK